MVSTTREDTRFAMAMAWGSVFSHVQAGDDGADMGVAGSDGIHLGGGNAGNGFFTGAVEIVASAFSQGDDYRISGFRIEGSGRFGQGLFFCIYKASSSFR